MIDDRMLDEEINELNSIKEAYLTKIEKLKNCKIPQEELLESHVERGLISKSSKKEKLYKIMELCSDVDISVNQYKASLKQLNDVADYVNYVLSFLCVLKREGRLSSLLPSSVRKHVDDLPSTIRNRQKGYKEVSDWWMQIQKVILDTKSTSFGSLKFPFNVQDIQNNELKGVCNSVVKIVEEIEEFVKSKIEEKNETIILTADSIVTAGKYVEILLTKHIKFLKKVIQLDQGLHLSCSRYIETINEYISELKKNTIVLIDGGPASNNTFGNEFLEKLNEITQSEINNWSVFYSEIMEKFRQKNTKNMIEMKIPEIKVPETGWAKEESQEKYGKAVKELKDKLVRVMRIAKQMMTYDKVLIDAEGWDVLGKETLTPPSKANPATYIKAHSKNKKKGFFGSLFRGKK